MRFQKYALAILSFGLFSSCERLELDRSSKAARSNLEGVEQLKQGNVPMAQKSFMESLAEEPAQAVYQFNLGFSFEKSGRGEEALKSYGQIPKEQAAVKIYALYNKARLLAEAKKVDDALANYQEALNLGPDDEVAKEIKINIELLTAQSQQNGGGEGEDEQENQDQKDQQQSENEDKNKEKKYQQPKKQPQKFKSKELSENDVRRIFEELTQQEQKIRAEYNKDEAKESNPNGKDW